MRVRRLITSMLAVCLIVGVALSPVTTLAFAQCATMALTDTSAVSGDMPCCPSEQTSKGCPDCPLISLCALKTAKAGPALTESIPVRHSIRMVHSVFDDVAADGIVRPPPDHPPRHLI